MELRPFYFAHAGLFLVPVEEQRTSGITESYAAALRDECGVGDGFVERLNRSLARYRERVGVLWRRAPRSWFPPRSQNLCICTEGERARPYYQPFVGSSWLLYDMDFEPETSSVELTAFLMAWSERLWISQSMRTAVAQCLSWFLVLEPDALDDFRDGCRRTTRPDAEAFRALADALPWVLELGHETLRPPSPQSLPSMQRIPAMELYVPGHHAPALEPLVATFERVGAGVTETYRRVQATPTRGRDPIDRLCGWLSEHQPRVLVADRDQREAWDPDAPEDMGRLRVALAGLGERAAESICADLAVISESTRRFLAAVRDPDALPRAGAEVDQVGGAYLHENRGLMVYALAQPGLDILKEEGPPYHRLLLGARTAHEWGHLADDAGLIPFDATRLSDHLAALDEAGEIYDEIIGRARPAQIEGLAEELAHRPADQSLGRALAQAQLARMGDYKANLVARGLSSLPSMEAYVRVNVRSLARQPGSLVHRLARHAYEFQYLSLSRMSGPEAYFLGSTWFREAYVDRGICTLEQALRLFELMSVVCSAYRIDDDRFDLDAIA